MQAQVIRGKIISKVGSIRAAAKAHSVNYTALSQVINYQRATTHIRLLLHTHFGVRFDDRYLKTRKRKGEKRRL